MTYCVTGRYGLFLGYKYQKTRLNRYLVRAKKPPGVQMGTRVKTACYS
jgi:hypothetical protein